MPASPPPRAHLLQHPRFKECLARALEKHGLEDYFGYAVIKIVTGETDPRSVICCNSGCHPCAKDYLGAAEATIKGLQEKKRRFWPF
jgi:hypothetical protein